jgi:hypothetical protein
VQAVGGGAVELWMAVENQMALAFGGEPMIRTKSEHSDAADVAAGSVLLWISALRLWRIGAARLRRLSV